MDKVLVGRELLEQVVNTNMADYAVIACQHKEIRAILDRPAEAEGVRIVNGCVILDGMAFSKVEILEQRKDLCDALESLSAVTAERDRLDMECGRLLEGKVQDAETIFVLEAERDQLRAEVDGLREAFMKMRNVAAGYSNCCEFDSANTRRLEREFEAADELSRSSGAMAAKEA